MTSPANEKTIYWQSMLEKWEYSGLSQQAFSSREGIDVKRLIYWKRALIDRGLFTDRVSVSKVAKSKKPADKKTEEPKLLPVNIMATEARFIPVCYFMANQRKMFTKGCYCSTWVRTNFAIIS